MKKLTRSDLTLVAVLLATGGVLRLWNLGGQSQWYDEMLATVHASFSAKYILDLCWGVEIHPPLYYYILKLLQSIQANDAFLRLPSALAGIASLPLIGFLSAKLGSAADRDGRFIGITALGLACVNPMHIWISRQVRPYALMQLLCCVGFLLLFRILETPSRKNLLRLALTNAPIILLHHLGIVLMAGQCACLLVTRAFRLTTLRLKDFCLFATLSLLSMLPTLPFLISAKWLRASPFLQTTGEPQVMWDKLPFEALQFLNFGYFSGEKLWILPVAAILLGLVWLWRNNTSRGLACLTLLAVFPILLIVLGYTGHFTPVQSLSFRHFACK